MNREDFEGSLVLEQLAEYGLVEEFYEAVDGDDFSRVEKILEQAGVDRGTTSWVLQEMAE